MSPDGAIWLTELDPFSVLYEFGHRFDAVLLTDGDRHRFQTLSGYHGLWWDPRDDSNLTGGDTRSIGEFFSDAYSTCGLGLMPHPTRSGPVEWQAANGYQPSNRRQRLVCALIRKIGARAGGSS
jgi:hypothetical protein